jgi:hypothetical protein
MIAYGESSLQLLPFPFVKSYQALPGMTDVILAFLQPAPEIEDDPLGKQDEA